MELQEKILMQIEVNKLNGLDHNFLVAQLCVLNNKPYEEMCEVVDKLISRGLVTIQGERMDENTTKPQEVSNTSSPFKPTIHSGKSGKFDKNRKWQEKHHVSNRDQNIQSAYEMLDKQDKKHYRKSTRLTGKLQGTTKGYAFLICNDPNESDVFIPEKDLKGAMHNDIVSVDVFTEKNMRRCGKVIQILDRANDYVVGKIEFTKHYATVVPDDVKFGKTINVPLNKTMGASSGDKVVCKIEKYYATKQAPDGMVSEVLGKPNEIETEVLSIIRTNKLYEEFPKNVQEYAQTLPDSIDKSQYPNRLDYTNEITFTIDGEDTRDIDDAISLTRKDGNFVLGVHIADVGEYVKLNNIIDKEAFKRGTSVYFPNLVLPMLPRELSNGICSLNERVDRLTLSVFIEYDQNYNRVDYKVCEAIINSKKRYTYTEIQKIFDGDEETIKLNAPFVPMLNDMRLLAKALGEQRRKRGAIEFDIPEVQVEVDNLGKVTKISEKENKESNKLIESFMVAANEAIAEKFLKEKVPFVYRVHERPDEEKIMDFVNFVNSLGLSESLKNPAKVEPIEIQKIVDDANESEKKYVINKIALRSMKKAKYSPECLGHFGLASTFYCHYTSPIRRYPDLTIHRIIKDYLHNAINQTELAKLKEFVVSSSLNSSEREVVADKVERDVDDLYRVFYMQNHIGEDFDARISGVTEFGLFVELDNTVEGLVKLEDLPADKYEFVEKKYMLKGISHTFVIGQTIKVKSLRADILTRDIDFMLIS